jgi:hypothetical protein
MGNQTGHVLAQLNRASRASEMSTGRTAAEWDFAASRRPVLAIYSLGRNPTFGFFEARSSLEVVSLR